MKKTLYDVLQVSKMASPDVIEAAYQRLLEKFQSDGSEDAQNQIKFLQQAYKTLSNPEKKALYDQKLQDQEDMPQDQSDLDDTLVAWWKSSKVIWIAIATAAIIGFILFAGRTGVKNKVETVKEPEITKRQESELKAANDAKHLDNEAALVKGVVENQGKYIDESANVANRAIDVQQDAENRRRAEFEFRANQSAQALEMQRREQEARLEMQRKQQAVAEDKMAEHEKRHYECLNNAIAKYGVQKAHAMCPR